MSKKEKAIAEPEAQAAESKKARQRSPNYPAVGLRDAVGRLRDFYKLDGKAGAPPEIAAVHIGFSKPHGQAMSVLSALKKFGLLQEANGRLAPSQRGIEILNLAEDDPRRIKSLQEAALSPEVYRELIDEHRATGFPSNDAMERELTTYKGFNPNSVVTFVRDLKDSLDFAGITDITSLELEAVESEEAGMETQTVPSKDVKGDATTSRKPARPSGFVFPHAPTPPPGIPSKGASITVPVEFVFQDGVAKPVLAHISFDAPMKKEHLAMLRSILQAMEKELKDPDQ